MSTERDQRREFAIPLHVHSYYSLLARPRVTATSSPENLVQRARQLGFDTIALTDRDNFFGLGRYFTSCQRYSMKPLVSIELPLEMGFGRTSYVTLLANNQDGLLDLFSLTSFVKRDGRILTPDMVAKVTGNVSVLLRNYPDLARDFIREDGFFFALDVPPNQGQLEQLKPLASKMVIAHEVRMAETREEKRLKLLRQLLKIQEPKTVRENPSLHALAKPERMGALYQSFPQSLGRTRELAQSMKVEIPTPPKIRAKIVPEGMSPFDFLEALVEKGARTKNLQQSSEQSRLKMELDLINKLGFSDYVLVCYEIADFCKRGGIEFLVSGSGNNSLILYALGITSVDPKSLYFPRFLHEERLGSPDVDFLFPYSQHSQVVDFLLNRYNEATLLSVIHTLKADGIRLLTQKNGPKLNETDIQDLASAHTPHVIAKHPSGVILAPGVSQQQVRGNILAQVDKEDAEKYFNLPKLDLLTNVGLERLKKIRWRVDPWQRRYGVSVEAPQDHRPTLDRLSRGGTLGVTFVEGPFLQSLLSRIGKATRQFSFEHVVQALAIARPAATSRDEYFGNLVAGTKQFEGYPEISAILSSTFGAIIYQEQIGRLATEVAGLSHALGDRLRKMMTEKTTEHERQNLVGLVDVGLTRRGYPRNIREQIIDGMKGFAAYGFPEGHARAQAQLALELAYFAEMHPRYFWEAVLQTIAEKPTSHIYHTQAYVCEALRRGLQCSFPPIHELPTIPYLSGDGLVVGKALFLQVDRNFAALYNQLIGMMRDPRVAEKDRIMFQLEHFDLCLSNDPMELFPHKRFVEQKESQHIVGVPVRREQRGNTVYVSLESGKLVHLSLTPELLRRKGGYLTPHFWHVRITPEPSGSWSIVDILPFDM